MNLRRLSLLLVVAVAGLSGCSVGPTFHSTPPPSTPSITSISPTNVTAGGPAYALTVNGSNFNSGTAAVLTVLSNPMTPFSNPPTTFVSATQLTVQISAADIASPGTVQLQVENSDFFMTATSNAVSFVVNPGPPGVNQAISVGVNGATPNGASSDPVLSKNGRFVAFASQATNLLASNTNFGEGYVRDTCLGTNGCSPLTLLVSAINGGTPANPVEGDAQGGATPSIGNQESSQDLFIGFLSAATNLITPNTTFQQAYVRDTCLAILSSFACNPVTVLASGTQSGGEPNGAASAFTLAANSCNAAFVSAGTDLVNGGTIPNEIYLASCSASSGSPVGSFKTSALVSASSSGVPGDQGAQQPAISSDGRFVAFASTSTNLTSTPNGGFQHIYLRDTCLLAGSGCSPSTVLVSADNAGNALAGNSQLPAISDDGRFVVFTTQTSAAGGGLTSDVFVRDTCSSSSGPVMNCTPSTTTMSVAATGGPANGPSSSTGHAISGDGRFVVFSSSATNLIAGGNASAQVFVRDTCSSATGSVPGCVQRTVLVSVNNIGPTGGFDAAISEDGHFVAFVNETIGPVRQVLFAATGF